MAFTTFGLNQFLEGFKENFDVSNGSIVAKTIGTGAYIDAANIEFGSISNGSMDLTSNAVLDIPAGGEVGFLALYDGQVSDQSSMDNANKLAELTFPSGTYAFTNDGTLTITSFEINVADNN